MPWVKFATQVEAKTLKEIRAFAKESDQSISKLVNEALRNHLQRGRVRPAFRSAMGDVINQHDELLRRLAR